MLESLDAAALPASEQSAAIAKLLVGTVAEFTGRGPDKVRAYLSDDTVTVVLRDTLTKAERTLAERDQGDLVVQMRRAFQREMSPVLIAGVEQITGRQVEAFLSDHHLDPDIAVETFVLAPRGAAPVGDPRPEPATH